MDKLRSGIKQKGFTLVELLVVLAITAMITMTAGTVIVQTLTESGRSSGRLTASQQVQNAGFWVKYDATKAQVVMNDDPETPSVTEFLTLVWYDWNNTKYRVAYTIQEDSGGLKKLVRDYSVGSGPAQSMIVADSLDGGTTTAVWDGNMNMLTLAIQAEVGGQSAVRTYQVKPRPVV
ncbi:MAG: prepilin-type N-terminal cleavage/methylation domain-containing protein [Dehalococcoidia bacterium]